MLVYSYSLMDNVVRKRTTYYVQEINIQTWLLLKYDIRNKYQQTI